MKRKLELNTFSSQTDSNDFNPWSGNPFSQRYHELLAKRKQLPVYEFKAELQRKVLENQVVIIEGETGSGKTTQIPQFVLSVLPDARPLVACTQPRRVAGM
jgi:HrpA-like RNA helicase